MGELREFDPTILGALKREIVRQCSIGAGDISEDGETGLISVVADLDPHGLSQALAGFARIDCDETGWLIEHDDAPKWLTLRPGEAAYEACWTTESLDALRFCRRSDAEDYVSAHFGGEGPIRITEHIWTSAKATSDDR